MPPLGFSVVGCVFLVGLFVPNLIWASRAKPVGYDPSGEDSVLRGLERVGQVITTVAALVFADTNVRNWSGWSWWLVAAVALMALDEAYWVRYFRSRRAVADFYRSAAGVPVPLASLPVTAFALLGIYGRAWPLTAAAVVLGIGHVGIHLKHRRALAAA